MIGYRAGYDEGGFSASVSLPSFVNDFNLVKSHWKHDPTALVNRNANITSFNILGAAFGALSGLILNDYLGRVRSWRLGCLVWASGLFVQVFSSGIYGLILFARIWSGLGSGLLTVTTPLYLSEIAPTRTRGLVVSVYMVNLLVILTLGEYLIFCLKYGSRHVNFLVLKGSSSTMPHNSTCLPREPSIVSCNPSP